MAKHTEIVAQLSNELATEMDRNNIADRARVRAESLAGPVHFSTLKAMGQSPAHYRQAVIAERKDTPAMALGRAVHLMVLRTAMPFVYDGGDRRGKGWDMFKAAVPAGADILTRSEYDRALAMKESVEAHTDAVRLLKGDREQTLSWSIAGRQCEGTPDVIGDGYVTDLKTTATANPQRFMPHAIRMAYHAQLAWYADAVDEVGMPHARDLYIVAVESYAPYPVVVYQLTPHARDQGLRMCRLWLDQVVNCEASGTWPGYAQSIIDLDASDDAELIFGDES